MVVVVGRWSRGCSCGMREEGGGGVNAGRSSKPGCDGEGHADSDRFPLRGGQTPRLLRQLRTE